MKTIEQIFNAYTSGYQELLLVGRSLDDLHVNAEGQIRPLRTTLIREVRARNQMVTLQFNLAFGARFQTSFLDKDAADVVQQSLRDRARPLLDAVRLTTDQSLPPYERLFRLFFAVMNALESSESLPPLFLMADFGEDLVPCTESSVVRRNRCNKCWLFQARAVESPNAKRPCY